MTTKTVLIRTTRRDRRARMLARDTNWQDAAARAIRHLYGPHARAWAWQQQSPTWYRTTVVEPARGGGAAVLAEVSAYLE